MAVTVDTLFALANKRLATNEYVEVRRFDEEYGIPEWIGYGRKDVTDTGGYIEVTDFKHLTQKTKKKYHIIIA